MDEGLDLTSIRSRFSALSRRVNGFPAVYLDGPGGSQTPDSVARAVADYLLGANANLGGPFVTSVASEQLVHDAHLAAADFLGCTEEEVVFGANTTTINFLLAHAVARTLEPRRRDHRHRARPRRERFAVAARRRRPRPHRPHGATRSARRHARRRCRGGADHSAHARGRVHARLQRAGLDPRCRGAWRPPRTRPARWCGSTACTWLPTGASTAPGSTPTCCSPPPTSSSGRISASPPCAATWRARCRPTGSVPSLEVPAGHRFETGTLCHEALAGFLAAIEYLESLGAPARRPVRPPGPGLRADRGPRARADPADAGAAERDSGPAPVRHRRPRSHRGADADVLLQPGRLDARKR